MDISHIPRVIAAKMRVFPRSFSHLFSLPLRSRLNDGRPDTNHSSSETQQLDAWLTGPAPRRPKKHDIDDFSLQVHQRRSF
jgi:hypothetical protein